MRYTRFSLLTGLLLASSALQAQRSRAELGLGLDRLNQVGSIADSADRRKGWAIRLQANIPWKRYMGFRAEGSYTQVQYKRPELAGPTGINETDFSVGGYFRALYPGKTRSPAVLPYVLGGALVSIRASCDYDNAFASTGYVRCAGGEDFLLGWGAGVGAQFGNWLGVKWFVEGKYLAKTTAAAGGNLVAISIGAGQ